MPPSSLRGYRTSSPEQDHRVSFTTAVDPSLNVGDDVAPLCVSLTDYPQRATKISTLPYLLPVLQFRVVVVPLTRCAPATFIRYRRHTFNGPDTVLALKCKQVH
jgi:hypothetical protein